MRFATLSRSCRWAVAAVVATSVLVAPGFLTATQAAVPRANANNKRMYAVTFTNLVVYDNGAGYVHAFWRTLGTAGPDEAGRLQWGRGCPDVSDRTFAALHTAFSHPKQFFLIVDKAVDPRQPQAYCVSGVELEMIQPPPTPPTPPAGGSGAGANPNTPGSQPPALLKSPG